MCRRTCYSRLRGWKNTYGISSGCNYFACLMSFLSFGDTYRMWNTVLSYGLVLGVRLAGWLQGVMLHLCLVWRTNCFYFCRDVLWAKAVGK